MTDEEKKILLAINEYEKLLGVYIPLELGKKIYKMNKEKLEFLTNP